VEFDYPRQKRKMKRDLILEDFSVLGIIIDCVALRKLVPDYRPINRRPDKILKYPLINQFDGALVYLFVSAKTKNRQQTFKKKMARRRRGKISLDKTRGKSA